MPRLLDRLQPLGRSLMLPIAVLPAAALLLRLGQPDLLDLGFVAAAGAAIFASLGLLFAIGVAIGLAKDNNGAAALAGAVAYVVATQGAEALLVVPAAVGAGLGTDAAGLAREAWRAAEIDRLGVPCGILSGLLAGFLYNRYSTIRLPEYLAFFGGRRFVPIAAGLGGLGLAAAFGWGFPVIRDGVAVLSRSVVEAGPAGLFGYGVLNRLLVVTGLHHIINNVAWFLIGDFNGTVGDLNRFFAGDPRAGGFMTGFFPVMMFGLPGACLAMYLAADRHRRRAVAGQYASLALTSFLTGVTEPIEFAFLFNAPVLFGLHAVLTGASMALMDALGVRLGFGFSAGSLDFVLNLHLTTRPWLLAPVGLAYFVLYFALFRFAIVRFDLKTPGREPDAPAGAAAPAAGPGQDRGRAYLAALGGAANIRSIDACTTRLRLELHRPEEADESILRAAGARGVVRVGADGLQVVIGPQADLVAQEIRQLLPAERPSEGDAADALFLAALGGAANIRRVTALPDRLRIELRAAARADGDRAVSAAPYGAVFVSDVTVHAILGDGLPVLGGLAVGEDASAG